MARKSNGARIYWRTQAQVRRAYADLRSLGGGQVALIPAGETRATTDSEVAASLFARHVEKLKDRKRQRHLVGVATIYTVGEYARHHLMEEAREGKVSDGWLTNCERMLQRAVDFLDYDRRPKAEKGMGFFPWIGRRDAGLTASARPVYLTDVTTLDVRNYLAHLDRIPTNRGARVDGEKPHMPMGAGSKRHHLSALSKMYRRGLSEAVVPLGYNPVAALLTKPTAERKEVEPLQIDEASLLLEAAFLWRDEQPGRRIVPCIYPLLATFLMTGGRQSEVTGLHVEDLLFDQRLIAFRENTDRSSLKTKGSRRFVPMPPQLYDILQEYVFIGGGPKSGLLFRSSVTGGPITDLRKALDALGELCGFEQGFLRTKRLRHTFATHRLQCLDHGHPISPWTVSRELGHTSAAMVEKVYGHQALRVRERQEHLEFRAGRYAARLGERLTALRAKLGAPSVRDSVTVTVTGVPMA